MPCTAFPSGQVTPTHKDLRMPSMWLTESEWSQLISSLSSVPGDEHVASLLRKLQLQLPVTDAEADSMHVSAGQTTVDVESRLTRLEAAVAALNPDSVFTSARVAELKEWFNSHTFVSGSGVATPPSHSPQPIRLTVNEYDADPGAAYARAAGTQVHVYDEDGNRAFIIDRKPVDDERPAPGAAEIVAALETASQLGCHRVYARETDIPCSEKASKLSICESCSAAEEAADALKKLWRRDPLIVEVPTVLSRLESYAVPPGQAHEDDCPDPHERDGVHVTCPDRPHFISSACEGESCQVCFKPATHKVGEEVPHDDPYPPRHNYTAYVCCEHFCYVLGSHCPAVIECRDERAALLAELGAVLDGCSTGATGHSWVSPESGTGVAVTELINGVMAVTGMNRDHDGRYHQLWMLLSEAVSPKLIPVCRWCGARANSHRGQDECSSDLPKRMMR